MKNTKKHDLLELQNLFLQSKRARGANKEKLQAAMEKVKNRVPEYLAERVEDFLHKGTLALVSGTNGACGSCYLLLPQGVANTLALTEGLFICENCGHFVYADSFEPQAHYGRDIAAGRLLD